MPLSENDLQDPNRIFAELKRQYGPKRQWTVADLQYNPPSPQWIADTRPQRGRAGAPTPTQYEVEMGQPDATPGGGRCSVTIVALTAARQTHLAGSILNH